MALLDTSNVQGVKKIGIYSRLLLSVRLDDTVDQLVLSNDIIRAPHHNIVTVIVTIV